MVGLASTSASSASLLLNLEGLATMAIAWIIFQENVDRRLLAGAAAILGGASLNGGKGTIWGALIGVCFIALINNALIIGSVSSYWQSIITGGVLVGAVAMDRFMKEPAS